MSVLVPDLEVFNSIYNKADLYKYNNVCDIDYCYTFSAMEEKQIKKFVLDLLWLNEVSYNQHYGENKKPYLHDFVVFKNERPINAYQMLKYLECIDYNIEIETIEHGWIKRSEPLTIDEEKKESYNLLKKVIEEIKNAIISQLPEYSKAKWRDKIN